MKLPRTLGSLGGLTPAQKWVILLGALALGLGLANLGKAVIALQYAARLPALPMTLSLSYLAGMGLLWGITFIVCSVGLSRFREWGRRLTLAAVSLYQAHAWVNRLLFATSDYARRTQLRDLAFSAVLLAAFWGSLIAPPVREIFDDRGENGHQARQS